MRLYFARHGESEANLLREFSNRGWRHGLTERGREQAAALARTLRDAPVARVYTSPLMRAVQTAEIVSAGLGIACEAADALREYDCGVLEGRSDPASWGQYEAVSDAWLREGRPEARLDGGESFLDMRARFLPFIERLTRTHGPAGGGAVLIGHGGLYRCMLPLVLVNVDAAFGLAHPIGPAGVVVTELGPDGLVCRSWCGRAVAAP